VRWDLGLVLKVLEDLLNHLWVFDISDDFDGAAAFAARLNVDIEYALQSLCPSLGGASFGKRWRFNGYFGLVTLALLRRGHQGVRCWVQQILKR
jgi:hypothetical protein